MRTGCRSLCWPPPNALVIRLEYVQIASAISTAEILKQPTALSRDSAVPTLGALALYVLFAWAVFILQGPAPDVNIDHISYFKLADEIRAQHPDGAYWRQFSSVASYGVMLAYLYDVTGSHVLSMKLLLAGMTVAYLVAFQIFMSMATRSQSQAVLFSIMSAFFVSFGASFWGVTDFSASLNRTLILPFVVIIVWGFLRYYDSPWRYTVFPLLVLFSLLHLSTYYVILVLVTLEGLDFLFLRRCRIDRRVAFFVLALIAAAGVRETIEYFGIGFTRFSVTMVSAAIPHAGNDSRRSDSRWSPPIAGERWPPVSFRRHGPHQTC